MGNPKAPDRLNISKNSRRIIDKIDSSNFMNLDSSHTSRATLFSFAMAIGLDTMPTKMDSLHPGGLVLDSSIDSRTKSLIYSYIISMSDNKDTLDEVTDKENVYTKVQELANTGFEVIEDYMNNHNEEDALWEILNELDQQFEELDRSN